MKLDCCALCDRPFDGEKVLHSREHIIPNSIGGQEKVRGIICKECNDRTGMEWDSPLAKQFLFLSVYIKIKRDDGKLPAAEVKTSSGECLRVHADGRLTYPTKVSFEALENGGLKVSGRFSTMEEAVKAVEGLKKKYPNFDAEGILKQLNVEKTYLAEPIGSSIHIHGDAFGRSIVKSALVLAIHAGASPKDCEFAKRYLSGDDDVPCWCFYYHLEVVANRDPMQIFHSVAVAGNPDTGQLIGYVELFRTYRMLVLLSADYEGKAFSSSCTVDPTTGEKLDFVFDLDLSADEVITACNGGFQHYEAIAAAFDQLMSIALPRSYQHERQKVFDEGMREGLSQLNLVPGQRLTPAQAAELARVVVERLTPCILHQHEALRTPIKPPEGPECS